ncbi:MAG: PD40 domain-containing protein [Acidobacteria bacterium]|nr:PD40 domain-containing protein [Acidobacteriota bacterium]
MDTQTKQLYAFGDFCLDPGRRLLLRLDGEPVPLTPKAFETLLILVRRHGSVVEKDELLREVWPDTFVEEATLAQNVFTLRRALGQGQAEPRYIETVPKHGYRFVADVRELRADLVVEKHTRTHIVAEELEVPDAPAEASPVTKARGFSLPAIARGVRRHPGASALGASCVVIAAALLLFNLYGRRPAPAPFERMRLSMLTDDGEVVRAAISPDGKYVVTARREGAREGLWVRQTRAAEQVQIVAPADVHFQGLTFSPDGAAVYYVAYERGSHVAALDRVGVLGGTPARVLVDIDSPAAFSPDGRALAFVRNDPNTRTDALMVANADGTDARPIAARRAPEYFSNEGPGWSPDGREVACAVGRTEFNRSVMGVVAVRAADGVERVLTPPRWDFVGQVAYTPDGGVLLDAWDSGASLLARQIWRLNAADGTARRITNDLNSYHGLSLTADGGALVSVRATRATSFWLAPGDAPADARQITSGAGDLVGEGMGLAWTPDGRLVYGSNAGGDVDVWVMDADGRNRRQLTTTARPDVKPSVSPDGSRVVFVSWRTGTSHLWRMDADGSNLLQLTNGAAESYPQISPDGRWVVYLSAEQNRSSLWKVPIEGGEPVRVSERWSMTPTFSPDGKEVACFYEDETSGALKLALVPSGGGDLVKLFDLPQTVFLRAGLHWTPDGGALRYVDNGGGVSNIWEQRVAGGAPKRLTDFTSNKIFRLAWSRDGRQLAFERGAEFDDATLISDFK